jgi:hypothetical protein
MTQPTAFARWLRALSASARVEGRALSVVTDP